MRELEVLHLRKENSCISIKVSIMFLNLLVVEARLPLTIWNFKEAKLPFDLDKDFLYKAFSNLINSGVKTVSQDYLYLRVRMDNKF